MLYFQFHVGDWESGTRLMSPIEKGVYIELIVYYYSVERPITEGECKRIARGYANAEANALAYVLQNHFIREGDTYRHKKCDEVIAEFHDISQKRSRAARKSLEARRKRGKQTTDIALAPTSDGASARASAPASADATGVANGQLTISHKPEAITTEEKKKEKEKPARETAKSLSASLQKPEGVSDELWQEWVAFKKKRCKSCTPRMVKHLCDEAAKAGITPEGAMTIQLERGWAGFEADYISNSSRGRFSGSRTAPVEIPFDQRDYNEGINDDNTF